MKQALEKNHERVKKTRSIAIVVCLSALCVGTNYAMLPLSNVKLMDTVVFTTSLAFGFATGAAVAALSWLVYGTLNPLGFSAPILATVILSEMVYPYAGLMVRRNRSLRELNSSSITRSVVLGTTGFLCTLAYDLITNAVSG
ncbi:MAG: hypothetical protein QXI32_06325, partial [Candidatus Bathyarchaeia archaeon]